MRALAHPPRSNSSLRGLGRGGPGQSRAFVTYVHDDVTYVYDDVTYVYDDVTYVYDDVTYVYLDEVEHL